MSDAARPLLSRRDALLYSAGELAPNALGFIIATWVLRVYRGSEAAGYPPLVPAALFGGVFVFGRVIDAVANPLVGHWSDRTRTRWGRRRPFLAGSLLPLSVCFLLLWTPPQTGETVGNGLYLLLVLSGFFFAYTCYYGPYLALLPELTPTAHSRNEVSTYQAVFKVVAMIAATQFGGLRALGRLSANPAHAFLLPGLLVAVASAVALALPLLAAREPAVAARDEQREPLVQHIAAALRSRPFRYFVAAFFMAWFGMQTLLAILPLLPSAVLGVAPERNDAVASLLLLAAVVAGAASFPGVRRAMDRLGRPRTFSLSLGWFALTAPLLLCAHSVGGAVVVLVLAGPGIGGFLCLPHALMADVCDDDARRTGQHREAVFFGVQGLIVNGAMGLAIPAATALIQTLGQTAANPGGLRACFVTAGLAAATGMLCFRGFERSLSTEEPS